MKRIFSTMLLLFLFINVQFFPTKGQQKQWENYIAGGKRITALAEEDNIIWVGTDIGLIKLNKNSSEISFYDKTTGLPSNNITAIAIDKDGNKWVGGGFGLAKFNNSDWEFFNTSNSPLPSNYISALYVDKKGNIWMACAGEYPNLVKYDKSDWIVYDINNSALPDRGIMSITEDSSSIWISTHGGLVKFDGNNWQLYNTTNSDIPGVIVNSVAVDDQNNKWIALGRGLVKFNNSTWTEYHENTPLWQKEVNTISIDQNGILWLGVFGGLVKFDLNTWTVYDEQNSDLPAHEVDVIMTDQENNKWVGSFDWENNGRLAKFDEENWIVYKTWKGELTSNYINFSKEDSKGNIWIGSDNSLISINNGKWKTYVWQDSLNPIGPYRFNSFAEGEDGNLWFSILGDWPTNGSPPVSGLLKHNNQNWTEFRPFNSGLPVCVINKLDFSNANNSVWLATSVGPVKFDGSTWTVLDTIINIIPKKVLSCLKIDGNTIWFGSPYYGLIKFDGTNWQLYNSTNSGLPDDGVGNINKDNYGNLWICTGNGLAKFDGVNWTVFNTSNSGLTNNLITDVDFDKDNALWIASYGGGVTKFDGNNWTNYNYENSPILGNHILDIDIDKYNNKWIVCDMNGISLYNENGISSVRNETNFVPEAFLLQQNYPNPFNPVTNIEYEINKNDFVTIKIYDILGKIIKTLAEKFHNPGKYQVQFDGSNLPSGIYFYTLQSSSFIETKKMVLLK